MSADTEKLADDLFRLVEFDQGFSYISDGMGEQPRAEIIRVARIALDSHKKCVRLLSDWLARADVKNGACQKPHGDRSYGAWLCVTDGDGLHLHLCGTHARRYTGRSRYKVQAIERGVKYGSRVSTGCVEVPSS